MSDWRNSPPPSIDSAALEREARIMRARAMAALLRAAAQRLGAALRPLAARLPGPSYRVGPALRR